MMYHYINIIISKNSSQLKKAVHTSKINCTVRLINSKELYTNTMQLLTVRVKCKERICQIFSYNKKTFSCQSVLLLLLFHVISTPHKARTARKKVIIIILNCFIDSLCKLLFVIIINSLLRKVEMFAQMELLISAILLNDNYLNFIFDTLIY